MDPEHGDKVKITTDSEEFIGILMPRPEILEKGIVAIKLDTGYNIGIDEKKIKKIEVLEKYKLAAKKHPKIGHQKNLPTVSVLSFGGTISSKVDYKTGGTYADYTAEDFVEMLPELEDAANIRAEKVMGIMSEDMNPAHWDLMARRIAKELNDDEVKGVVVTHGTDTMHYSAAAMSFFLKNINKPVIFTGAQRSIDRGSSDAFSNLLCSVHAAAKFDGAAVAICMHATSNDGFCILSRGTKVRKMHTSRRDAFRPIDELPLAKIYDDGKIEAINKNHKKRNHGKAEVDSKFEQKTALVYTYPGMDAGIFDYFIKSKYRGIVIVGTGLGHVAGCVDSFDSKSEYSVYNKLKELRKNGIAIVIGSQTIYGRVHPYVYTNLRRLSMELDCIYSEDMLPETAYVKLGWVLSHENKIEEIKKMMLANVAGEITERSDESVFLY